VIGYKFVRRAVIGWQSNRHEIQKSSQDGREEDGREKEGEKIERNTEEKGGNTSGITHG